MGIVFTGLIYCPVYIQGICNIPLVQQMFMAIVADFFGYCM